MGALRGWLLAGGLAATVAAAVYEPETDMEVVPISATEATPVAAAVTAPTRDEKGPAIERPPYGPAAADLFPSQAWQPPPSAPVVAVPKAPPLPFRYLGRLQDDGRVVVFLGQGQRTHLVSEGQVVAEYRVERIHRDGMTLVYQPLNETQHLSFGLLN